MNPEVLADWLEERLRGDIDALGPQPDTPTGKRCARRLADAAGQGVATILLLAEPLLDEDASGTASATLLACARLHLYARVLDDALDENLALDRRNLLRIQPLYWRAVHALGVAHAGLTGPAAALLDTTVTAVEIDDRQAAPAEWGRKNFHLLLAPLLLSADGAHYRAARPGLEAVLAVAQAHEEARQGRLLASGVQQGLAVCLARWLDPEAVGALRVHGWHGAAARLVADTGTLLSMMNRTPIP